MKTDDEKRIHETINVLVHLQDLMSAYLTILMQSTGSLQKETGSDGEIFMIKAMPDGMLVELPQHCIPEDDPPGDEVILDMPDSGLLFSFTKRDVSTICDTKYLFGMMDIIKADEEGKILPLTSAEIEEAREFVSERITKVTVNEEVHYALALY